MLGDQIYKQLQSAASEAKQNISMAKWTTFKIGGPARYMVTVASLEQLRAVLAIAAQHGLPTVLLGGGSNMLVCDEGFEGIVIRLGMRTITIDGRRVCAHAGAKTAEVASRSVAAGLTGFEWAAGVPGTIGGATRGNAGASGGEMKDTVVSVEALIDGEVVVFTQAQCGFGYRHSAFKENGGIILSVTLELQPDMAKEGMKKIHDVLLYRMTTQPKGLASTGCIFKNVETSQKRISAGMLIDQSGLKGTTVGGARVSEIHGNFVVNAGNATAQDIRQLVETIKEKVYSETGYTLHEEIQYVGF